VEGRRALQKQAVEIAACHLGVVRQNLNVAIECGSNRNDNVLLAVIPSDQQMRLKRTKNLRERVIGLRRFGDSVEAESVGHLRPTLLKQELQIQIEWRELWFRANAENLRLVECLGERA
jgi:hypothetical protein